VNDLEEKVAIVTGGSSGIGFAVAKAFLEVGMQVTIAARRGTILQEAAEALAKTGSGVLAVQADVSKAADVGNMIKQTIDKFGRVDILVNNAGIMKWNPVQRVKETDWDEIMAVNLKSAFLCTQAVLPIMKKQGSGYIFNISSMAAKKAKVGWGAYSVSKAGLMILTETLQEEVTSHNIKVTAICPAYVDTPQHKSSKMDRQRMIKPSDIARTILFLLRLSDHAIVSEILIDNIPIS
jgi:NAD(P)-dependent dehydrogenase (short-subunit alcohol dehydrogenase family)